MPNPDWSIVAEAWDGHADHVERMKEPATTLMLERIALEPGDRVLELGAGTGALSALLAARVAPGGSVHVTDLAAGMVEVARRRTAGLTDVTVAQLDAASTGLPDGSFDAVIFRMGLMFTPDPAAALSEIHRVLAPSGRVGIMVWAGAEHNPWLTHVGMAVMASGLLGGAVPGGAGEAFSLSDPGRLHDILERAGLHHVEVDEIDLPARFASPYEHFAIGSSLAPPLAEAIAGASPEEIDKARLMAADLTASYVVDDGLVLPGRALVATGHR